MNHSERLTHIQRVIEQGPFSASMASLAAYRAPDWYQDAKFGLFIHWGPYCVPAFGNEWYPRLMYQPGSPHFEHHIKTYGPQKSFGYKDFIPLFKAESFDARDWAQLFVASGAKYIVPVAEHHDGFQMYGSELSRWNAKQMGPRRDILGELFQAARAEGIVCGASSHRAEHYWYMDGVHKIPSDYTPELEDFYGPAAPGLVDQFSVTAVPPTAEFMDDWLARTCELVDLHRPQLVWFDWWVTHLCFRPYLEKFAAFYYNRAAEWGEGVAINYKYRAFDPGCAIFDVERGQVPGIPKMLWQNDTSVSKNSWGYVDDHDYKQPLEILCDLIEVVAKNGCMLLNIGPRADGAIPEREREMLQEIGRWLSKNGEAIYGSRAWRVSGEGPTQAPEGEFTDGKRPRFTGRDIRYTTRGQTLYAIALGRPEDELVLAEVREADGYRIATSMEGRALEARQLADGLHVKLDADLLAQPLPLAVRLNRKAGFCT